jgi:hypothetical protein
MPLRISNLFASAGAAIFVASLAFASACAESPVERNLTIPFDAMQWERQSPEIPAMRTLLWGDRDRDGSFGQLIHLAPGFDSGLHAHTGDYHGVLVAGEFEHVGPNGEGAGVRLRPGSYIRQAGGGMHIDRCVSAEPCVLFTFQYARADVIWPPKDK